MTDTTMLNATQTTLLAERNAVYRRRGIIAWVEAGGLLLLSLLAAKTVHVDWVLLTVLHETYADADYASTAFAMSGLFVVFSLHAISTVLKSKVLDRALAVIAAICAAIFIAGTCAMIGAIALTQGLGEIGEGLPDVDVFFGAAQEVVDDTFGTGIFEQVVLDFSVPLFTAAVCTAFLLTTFLLKCIVDLLVCRISVVLLTILQARQSARLFGGINHSLAREKRAQSALETARARRVHWQPGRVADVIVSVTEDMLRPFDVLVTERLLSGRTAPEELPIPHADGGPALDVARLEKRLSEIRESTRHERVLQALNEA